MKQIALGQWYAVGTLPYQADFSRHLQLGVMIPHQTKWFPAAVPGSVYRDLLAAGLIEDPYYGENSLHCEWVANRWWVYRTSFFLQKEDLEDTLKLTFCGIDYSARIYLNGVDLGHHEGMYIPFAAVVNGAAVEGENVLVCVLEHAPQADPQPGYTSRTRYLKARFNYKWDFACRLVNLGIYDEVKLETHRALSVSHFFFRPVKKENGWALACSFEADGYRNADAVLEISADILTAEGTKNVRTSCQVKVKEGPNAWAATLEMDGAQPLLWWPNGYGAQPLHDVRASFTVEGAVDDAVSARVGFRTLAFRHAEGREDALPYLVEVNGKRIYLKGTNMVPMDCMTGIPEEAVRRCLEAARDANIDFLRIWGGGHIESELFYRLCDEFGLMVLQEFTMSSSGCDDVPSRDPEFLALLEQAARHAVKQKRNHVSLIMMNGGNELTDHRYLGREDHEGHPATFDEPALAMLLGIVTQFAPDIMMLPSSASGPNALLKVGDLGNNHDVHGPWNYVGVYDHYDFYNGSDSIVHGEFGCGGMSNEESVRRFMPPEKLRLATSDTDRIWAHHSGGWDSYNGRERLMFGELYDLPFSDYIKVSQFVQAESLRYSLEANRRRQWKNVGQMTWQFNEPWPNVQCSNLVDYYGGKKLAWYFLKEAYAGVMTSMRYHKLFFTAGETFEASLHIINDYADAPYAIDCRVITWQGKLLYRERFSGTVREDESRTAGELRIALPADLTGAFRVVLQTECGAYSGEKEYLLLIADKEIPLIPSEQDRRMAQMAPNRPKNPQFDMLRADTAPVIDYVDRMRKRYL